MTDVTSSGGVRAVEVDGKAAMVMDQLASAVREYGRVVYANSLGAESMVVTDLIWTHVPEIDVITIDTGRLHAETYALIETMERRYQRRLRLVFPDTRAVEKVVSEHGINGFYGDAAARIACCAARKLDPFKRVVREYKAWITGIRREQSTARARSEPIAWDEEYGLYKISPLLDWRRDEIWHYIRARHLPYNPLHDQRFPSIGCQPCTRAVQPGEDERAGRWWWELTEHRECGLHTRGRGGSGL
jgi:phosphoadenosine phosphosulfate reductase